MSTPIIEVKNLGKVYSNASFEVIALQDVSLTIHEGEFVAIMGPSGSGKSTFMNVIGCLDTPTSGSYRLVGVEVSSLSDDQLAALRGTRIGFVFQTFNLIARTSALLNVEMPLFYNWRAPKEKRQLAAKMLDTVGLGQRADHVPSQLSGGQQQRVAIARALINDPAMILADEPTGALDSHTSEELMAIFQKLNAQGKTIVMVTHEEDVAHHAQRIIRFRDGRAVSDERVPSPINAEAVLAEWGGAS